MNTRLISSLQAVLDTTDEALQNWAEQTEIDVAVLADSDDVRANVEAQLRVNRTARDLLQSPALQDIRHLLALRHVFSSHIGKCRKLEAGRD